MDVRQLDYFIAVAQYLNFTEAAKHLYVAQSAVSHTIAELEKELGTKLFIRSKKAITLTPAGTILLREAFKITSLARGAMSKIKGMVSGESGELSIGYTFEPLIDRMVDCFKKFHAKHPEISIYYNAYDSISIARMLEDRELDIGFVRPVTIGRKEDVCWEYIYTDPFYVGLPERHRLSESGKIKLDMISGEPVVMMKRDVNPGMFDVVQQLYSSRGILPRFLDITNDIPGVITLSRIGFGLCILPGQFKKYFPDDMRFIQLDDADACHEIGVAWHKENSNPAVGMFLSELGIALPQPKAN